ncbi:SEC-C domain-containing protein [Mucilaginibacter sp. CAU 1740]|uniref:SEC-C domain-containing protein n=1 Tax=Mucilaginibacter sp. CAU 1740 TaxID=3140365 RepID=UPI00325BEEED
MSKTGRNEPCPCGSGKKYKNCHWSNDEALPVTSAPAEIAMPPQFSAYINKFRGLPILRFLAYLQTMPENHGRNFSVEMIATDVLRHMPENDKRPFMPWPELCKNIAAGVGFGDEEPENMFTENVISANGNQIVFPGVYRNGTTILNELLEIILTGENDLPDDYKKSVYSAAGLLLFMSNQVAEDLAFERYEFGEMSDELTLPDFDEFIKSSNVFMFDRDFMEKIAGLYGYELTALDQFIIDLKDPKLAQNDPENALVSVKPLIKENEDYCLFMPTTVVSALINCMYDQAKAYGCHDRLMQLLHKEQFYRAGNALNFLGWQLTDIKLPKKDETLLIRESVWRFDNQKLGYLCFLPLAGFSRDKSINETLIQRNKEVVSYLKSLEAEIGYEVLTIAILSETGHGEYFAMPKLTDGDRHLFFTLSELTTIAYDKESDFLTLWKFAGVFKAAVSRYEMPPLFNLLNLYAVYRQNHGGLTDSNSARPDGAMLMILPGHDVELKQEIKLMRDEHAAELLIEGNVRAFVNVIRKRDFAPIYAYKNKLSPEYRRLLDVFKIPIWVTNYQENSDLLAPEIGEAIMFWLYRLAPELSAALNDLRFVQFEVELVIDDQMLNGSEFLVKTVEPDAINISFAIEPPKLQLQVPYDLIYLMARPDNAGEKMLVKAVLNGLVEYIHAAGKEINLNAASIEQMVESVMQPDTAKMILFTDASANVELDERNLPPEHYFQETDSSFVLDNLTGYLPDSYDIPEKITGIEEKIKLCDTIVTGVIKELTNRIAEFDGEYLVKWLIKWNERCTYTREIREIRTPAKVACFADFEKEVEEINKHDLLLVPTAHALRTLIEFVAAKPPSGKKLPNYADVDVMLALVDELTNWGSLSEAMRMRLNDPEMGLLPSGRIGTGKGFQENVLIPYSKARTSGTVAGFMERFEKRYVVNYEKKTDATDKSLEADAAFRAEFGVTISNISDIAGVLINYGFTQGESCAQLTSDKLFNLLKTELPELDNATIEKTVDIMTLLTRPGIGVFPQGYSSKDIFPWRFGRNLSYLRRPLVKLESAGGESIYYFGFRHLKTYFDNLLFLIFTGKLPEDTSEEMNSYMGKINHEKGTPYRNEVKDWLKTHTDLEVVEHEVKIEPGGHIPAEVKYGDTDVMAVDHTLKKVYSIECKNLVGARNIHEMKNELDLYLGREGQAAKAKINKHVKRDEYLKANPEKLKQFLKLASDDYEVVSLVIAAEEMPMTYIAKERVPLPVIAFHRLKLDGKKALG